MRIRLQKVTGVRTVGKMAKRTFAEVVKGGTLTLSTIKETDEEFNCKYGIMLLSDCYDY